MGKLTVSGDASVYTLQVKPHLMFQFSDPKAISSVPHSVHLRFSLLYCPSALLAKETLNTGFTVIRYSII
jgi:hypothetical protein